MKTRRIVFEEVSTKRTFRWVDPETGSRRQQTKKFWQTLSPFNVDSDGQRKTRGQAQMEIERQADLWLLRKENDAREGILPGGSK